MYSLARQVTLSVIGPCAAGAAYLPLDTSYPSHMLESVLEDALPVVVITSPQFESKLKNVIGNANRKLQNEHFLQETDQVFFLTV